MNVYFLYGEAYDIVRQVGL